MCPNGAIDSSTTKCFMTHDWGCIGRYDVKQYHVDSDQMNCVSVVINFDKCTYAWKIGQAT